MIPGKLLKQQQCDAEIFNRHFGYKVKVRAVPYKQTDSGRSKTISNDIILLHKLLPFYQGWTNN